MAMDVVDYDIRGAEMQFVEIELDPGEAAIGEAGSMMFMDAGIRMDTIFGDGSAGQGGGLLGKLLGAGKRLVTGESLFTTVYSNGTNGKARVPAKVTGPGTVWLQSLPFSRLASRVFAAAPQRGGSREEGSLLGAGAIGGVLGGLFGGDDE
ncbi:MAG: AIM24 family protein [Caldimonas sp.]